MNTQHHLTALITPFLIATIALCTACQGESSVTSLDTQPSDAPAPTTPVTSPGTPTPGQPSAPSDNPDRFKPVFEDDDAMREHAKLIPEANTPVDADVPEDMRQRHRLDIDQLDASIKQVSGGLSWTEERGSDQINLFEDLSNTLGKPDYINTTQEDLSTSLLFQKFLGDAARQVCDELATRESAQYALLTPAKRHLFIKASPEHTYDTHPDEVDANLRALLLRFHGTYIQPDQPERLSHWRWLFTSAMHVSDEPATAWRTVCVGMISHPDFYMY